jgi:predicted DNA-binding transcriptional regulator AlpA
MPIEIEGVRYFLAVEVAKTVGVTRQTLWRWRQGGKIPRGHRYRDRQVAFSEAEFEAIREYAHRIEPIDADSSQQLRLFNGSTTGSSSVGG